MMPAEGEPVIHGGYYVFGRTSWMFPARQREHILNLDRNDEPELMTAEPLNSGLACSYKLLQVPVKSRTSQKMGKYCNRVLSCCVLTGTQTVLSIMFYCN